MHNAYLPALAECLEIKLWANNFFPIFQETAKTSLISRECSIKRDSTACWMHEIYFQLQKTIIAVIKKTEPIKTTATTTAKRKTKSKIRQLHISFPLQILLNPAQEKQRLSHGHKFSEVVCLVPDLFTCCWSSDALAVSRLAVCLCVCFCVCRQASLRLFVCVNIKYECVNMYLFLSLFVVFFLCWVCVLIKWVRICVSDSEITVNSNFWSLHHTTKQKWISCCTLRRKEIDGWRDK